MKNKNDLPMISEIKKLNKIDKDSVISKAFLFSKAVHL